MSRYFHVLFMILMLTLLTGCNENHSDIWYMQHPEALKKVVIACQSATNNKNQNQCDRLMPVAENLQAIIMAQQTHPEEFGMRIMAEEQNAAKLRDDVKQAQQKFDKLKQDGASTEQLRLAQDDLYKAKQTCTEQTQKIKVYLAVVGLSSPE